MSFEGRYLTQRPTTRPSSSTPIYCGIPAPIPFPPACRHRILVPLSSRPVCITPVLPPIPPSDIAIPPGAEIVYLIRISSCPPRGTQIARRVPVHILDGTIPVVIVQPLQPSAIPVPPARPVGHVTHQRAAVAIGHDEDIWPLTCQAVLDATPGSLASAVGRSSPVLSRLEAVQLATALVPATAFIPIATPADEGFLAGSATTVAELGKEWKAVVCCILIVLGVWLWMPPGRHLGRDADDMVSCRDAKSNLFSSPKSLGGSITGEKGDVG